MDNSGTSAANRDERVIVREAFGTTVKIAPEVGLNLLALWVGAAVLAGRRNPKRSWPLRLALGALSAAIWAAADFGHAFAHTISARAAGAPMDEIHLYQGMPRTIYVNNDVPPRVHIIRSLGGPIFNAVGLLAGLLLRALGPADSTLHELAGDVALGHGLLLGGSLAPLPIVDGGVILKWRLVEGGRTPEEADRAVQTAGVATGAMALASGAALATRRRWLPAVGLLGAGLVAMAAALHKLH